MLIETLAPGSFGPALMHDAVVSGDIIRLSDDVVRPFYQRRALDTVAIMHEAFDGLPYRIHQPEGAIFLWLWLEGLPISSDELYWAAISASSTSPRTFQCRASSAGGRLGIR